MSKKPYYFLTNISVEGVIANGQIGSPGETLFSNGSATYWGPGSIGYTGSQGAIGYTGSQGIIGYTGSAGSIPTLPTGILKGNGTTTFSAATAGTDYVSPSVATNFTARQTFTGSSTDVAAKFQNALEKVTVSATAATGTVNYNILTQSVLYYTTNASGNWTLNIRGDGTTSLNSIMANGESITIAFMVTNGATAYYQTGFQIDGTTVTPKWLGGTAPTSGSASAIDIYTVTIIKTASATYTAIISNIKYA